MLFDVVLLLVVKSLLLVVRMLLHVLRLVLLEVGKPTAGGCSPMMEIGCRTRL